jgi:hypothetical protein
MTPREQAEKEAKELAKSLGITSNVAREMLAQKRGYKTWELYLSYLVNQV